MRVCDSHDQVEPKASHFEDALSRLEQNLSDKMNTLFNRMEKCSELSVASSRAVAALSAKFEEHKQETEQRISGLLNTVGELRGSMNRLCSESQNLTMTALEECCNELVKQIKANTDNINRLSDNLCRVEDDMKCNHSRAEKEIVDIRQDFGGVLKKIDETRSMTANVPEEMRLIAEEAVNLGLEDINGKFTKDLEAFDLDWKDYRDNLDQRFTSVDKRIGLVEKTWSTRYDDLKSLFDERMKSEIDVRVKDTLLPNAVNKVRRDMETEFEELRRLIHSLPKPTEFPDTAIRNISNEIAQVQTSMNNFTSTTIPGLYREVELKIAHCEHGSQQRCLDLLKEFATELDFDIDRMIELVHSVFVQAHLPMPSGTSGSWQRFKEIMFDRENIGGIRVRRPILGEGSGQRPSSRLSSRRAARY
jgi:predicted  nucleic acid-binding Zn-ribbon protein